MVLEGTRGMTVRRSFVVRIDVAVAVVFATLFVWSIYAANEAAADAVRRYGHNVDSGALQIAAAIVYFAPVAFLFALASLSILRSWRIGRTIHWLAISYAIVPLGLAAVTWLARAL